MTRVVIVIGILLLGSLGINPITAQGDATPSGQITTDPVGDCPNRWFQVDVAAGESVTLTAGVFNSGNAPIPLRTFVGNAESAINRGFSAGTEDDAITGPALWVDNTPESFELAPGAVREWDVVVSVPADTPAGQYVAALVVSTDPEVELQVSDIYRQVLRSTMAIEITVPGLVTPGFEFGTLAITTDVTGNSLEALISNTGTVLVEPQGEPVLQDADGNAVFTASIAMGSVYADHTTTLQVPLSTQLTPGEYLGSLALTDPATGASASVTGVTITIPAP